MVHELIWSLFRKRPSNGRVHLHALWEAALRSLSQQLPCWRQSYRLMSSLPRLLLNPVHLPGRSCLLHIRSHTVRTAPSAYHPPRIFSWKASLHLNDPACILVQNSRKPEITYLKPEAAGKTQKLRHGGTGYDYVKKDEHTQKEPEILCAADFACTISCIPWPLSTYPTPNSS